MAVISESNVMALDLPSPSKEVSILRVDLINSAINNILFGEFELFKRRVI